MPTVQDVLSEKGQKLFTTTPTATVLQAVNQMNQHKCGAVVVMDDGQNVAGIFTERDVLTRVVGAGRSPATTFVGEVMTGEVVCCDRRADLDEVSALMRNRRIRHVPVCEDGRLLGLISIGDINAYSASNQEAHIHFLSEYIYGRV
jgi:CBS domain-containing protein